MKNIHLMGKLSGAQLQFFYALDQGNHFHQLGKPLDASILSDDYVQQGEFTIDQHSQDVSWVCVVKIWLPKVKSQTLNLSVIELSIEINIYEKNTFLPLLSFLLACASGEQKNIPENSLDRNLAKFEPKDGVLLFVGQELEAVGAVAGYEDGYLNHFRNLQVGPVIRISTQEKRLLDEFRKGLDGLWETHDWGDNDYNAMLQHNDPDYANMALAIGLQFVNHEEKVADGTHDAYIDRFVTSYSL